MVGAWLVDDEPAPSGANRIDLLRVSTVASACALHPAAHSGSLCHAALAHTARVPSDAVNRGGNAGAARADGGASSAAGWKRAPPPARSSEGVEAPCRAANHARNKNVHESDIRAARSQPSRKSGDAAAAAARLPLSAAMRHHTRVVGCPCEAAEWHRQW